MRNIFRVIALLVLAALALFPHLAMAQSQSWAEGGTMKLSAATLIEYGAGQTWTSKSVGPGNVVCGNATFGDPISGTAKSCRVKDRFECLPSPIGSGTKALIKSATKGDFVAWYCPGQELPAIVVCLKSTCGLAATKRVLAALASDPTVAGLNAAMAPFQRNAYSDAELIAVWSPYAGDIRKLSE